jgi:hypothetical protein
MNSSGSGNRRRNTVDGNGTRQGGPPPRKASPWEPPAMPSEESLKARPRLKLKPRSQNAGASSAAASGGDSSIFGGAKPADTAAKFAELELRDSEKSKAVKEDGAKEDLDRDQVKKEKIAVAKAKGQPKIFKEEVVKTKIAVNPFDLLGEE